jgi:hypothetical protein
MILGAWGKIEFESISSYGLPPSQPSPKGEGVYLFPLGEIRKGVKTKYVTINPKCLISIRAEERQRITIFAPIEKINAGENSHT